MTISASARNRLFNKFRDQYGDEDAAVLMDMLPPGGWDEVASKSDLRDLRSELRADIADVRGEIAELRGDIARIHERLAEVPTRRELVEIVDARVAIAMRSQLFAIVAMQVATIGGVIAAIRI